MLGMGSDTQADPKAQIRASLRAARDAVGPRPRAAAATRLFARLTGLQGACIAGYLPIHGEVDPTGAMRVLSRDNSVCVPVVMGPGAPLRFREWRPGCAVEPGPFGVPVPVDGGWRIPDVLIVPLVGFDASCARLGYGGGYYDRTLSGMGQTRTFGLAVDAQRADALPVGANDVRLDEVVTETRVYRREE